MWRWLAIAGMSMTPNLAWGQQMAAFFGIRWGVDVRILLPVMIVFGYVSGFFWLWIGGKDPRLAFMRRFIAWMRKPKAVAFAEKWGTWGGMTLGSIMVGQEPIILALRWLGVESKKIWIPMILANVISSVGFYYLTKLGYMSVESYY
jgi:hypothetical protein